MRWEVGNADWKEMLHGPVTHIPRRVSAVLKTLQRKIAAKKPDLTLQLKTGF